VKTRRQSPEAIVECREGGKFSPFQKQSRWCNLLPAYPGARYDEPGSHSIRPQNFIGPTDAARCAGSNEATGASLDEYRGGGEYQRIEPTDSEQEPIQPMRGCRSSEQADHATGQSRLGGRQKG